MTIYSLTSSFPYLEPVCCSMSSSNCCFLTCIQVSQDAGQVIWYSHLLKNFPQLVVIHTVKGFGRVNKAEIDVFLELSCFFNDSTDVGNLISGSSVFSKSSLNIWSSRFTYCGSLLWRLLCIAKITNNAFGSYLKFPPNLNAFTLNQWFSNWGNFGSQGIFGYV